MIHTVLFDLDGTLADTAPDLAHALNCVLEEQGQTALPFEAIRPIVSHGGTVLLSFGFNLQPDAPQFDTLRDRFLSIYRDNIAVNTRLFPGGPRGYGQADAAVVSRHGVGIEDVRTTRHVMGCGY